MILVDLETLREKFILNGSSLEKEQILYLIDRLPTMEVVRCNECAWFSPESEKRKNCPMWNSKEIKPYSDYCSYGERSEE